MMRDVSVMQRPIADIEVLRGVAITMVVLHQFKNVLLIDNSAKLNALFSFFDFWVGVDIFFAISGFVVARSLLPQLGSDIANKQFFVNACAFGIRRIFRLWPSAWLWLGLILVAVICANRTGGFGSLTANVEATVVAVLQVANFRFAESIAKQFEYGASFVYWSLSLQEQFYVLLPLLALVLKRRLATVLIVLLIVKEALALLFPDLNSMILTMLLNADALVLGVLLAIWSERPGYRLFEPTVFRNWLARWSLLPLLLVCLCALAAENMHVIPSTFRYALIGAVAVIPVFIASYDRNYLCGSGWLQSLLVWLGSRSYGIYLIHVPAFLLTKEIWFRIMPAGTIFDGAFNIRFTLTAAVLLFCLSELNYRLLENPLRRYGVLLSERFRRSPRWQEKTPHPE